MRACPNILFVLADQHRGDWLGGANPALPLQTPHLDALAMQGTRFTRAVCNAPLCGPSRACLASGREYDHCGVADHTEDYPLSLPTVYQALRDAGYWTLGCGKFDLHKAHYSWGTEGQYRLQDWGFCAGQDSAGKWDAVYSSNNGPQDPYMAYLTERGLAQIHRDDMLKRAPYEGTWPTPLPDDAYGDNWIGRKALHLLSAAPAKQPWFLLANFSGPHEPMDVTASMLLPYADTTFPPPLLPGPEFTPPQHQAARRNYAAMITNLDTWMGTLRDAVHARGDANNTLVVYASDHGEMLGDRGRWGKNVPYAPSVHVPLLVAGPEVAAGNVCDAPVSLIDIGATLLDYADAAPLPHAESLSLRPLLGGNDAPATRKTAFSGSGAWRMAFDGRYSLTRGFLPDGSDLLLDWNAPDADNLLPTRPDLAERLRHTPAS